MSEEEKASSVKPVAQGKIVKKKGRLWYKLKSAIMVTTIDEAEDYIIEDVLVPVILNGIADFLGDTVDFIFRGGRVGGRAARSSNKPNNYYGGNTNYAGMSKNQKVPQRNTSKLRGTDEVAFESMIKAKDVLEELTNSIDRFGEANVYDFYLAAQLEPPNGYADRYFGWYDLSTAKVTINQGYWYILMPDVVELQRR